MYNYIFFTAQPCFPVVGKGPSTLVPDPRFFCYPLPDLQVLLFTISPFSSNLIPFVRFSGVMLRSTYVSHPEAPPSSDLFNYLYYRCLYSYPDICFSIPIGDVPCAATSLLFAWLAHISAPCVIGNWLKYARTVQQILELASRVTVKDVAMMADAVQPAICLL